MKASQTYGYKSSKFSSKIATAKSSISKTSQSKTVSVIENSVTTTSHGHQRPLSLVDPKFKTGKLYTEVVDYY